MKPFTAACLGLVLILAGTNRAASQDAEPALILRSCAERTNPSNRAGAVRAMAKTGPEVATTFPALVALLGDKDNAVRLEAVRALGHILVHDEGNDTPTKGGPRRHLDVKARAAAVPALTEALKGPDQDVCFHAACALVQIEPANKAARAVLEEQLPTLLKLLKHDDRDGKLVAARALRHLGADAATAVPTLFRAEGLDKPTTAAVLEALEAIGPTAVPFLGKVLKEGDKHEREKAVAVLSRIGPSARDVVIPVLSEALTDGDVRMPAAIALRKLGPDHQPAVRILTAAAKDANKLVRRRALWALDRRAAVWVEVLKDKDKDCRLAADDVLRFDQPPYGSELAAEEHYRFVAAEALAGMGRTARDVIPDLTEALKDPNRDVRFYAACALVRIDSENKASVKLLVEELPNLVELLRADDGRRVIFAADVLGGMGAKAEPAVGALREVVAHPRQWAVPGLAAEEAIRKIKPEGGKPRR